jgi:tetratricopeptide (TPR) repeat protein
MRTIDLRSAAWLASVVMLGSCARPAREEPAAPRPAMVGQPAEDPAAASAPPKVTAAPAVAIAPGDASCAACHADIVRLYEQTAKSHAFAPFRADEGAENFDGVVVDHAASRRRYEVSLRDGRMIVTRYRPDESGGRQHVREHAVDWVIGSGRYLGLYLWQSPSGELFALPVAWYPQERRWAMAPGYDREDHDDFDRPFTRAEMFRVNDIPPHEPGSDAFASPQLFPTELPHGIGCGRCHGAGGDHARLAAEPSPDLVRVRETIINPARLPRDAAEAVCLQCHLQPDSGRTSLVRRFGRGDYDFTPGETLPEYVVPIEFREAAATDRFEMNHHGYRLRQSACYIASDGAMTCTTCHDAHAGMQAAAKVRPDRGRCLTCHDAAACVLPADSGPRAGDDNCTACHMPKHRAQDAVHVVMTDHRIQRPARHDPLSQRLLAPLAEAPRPAGEEAAVYPIPDVPVGAEADVYAAVATAADRQPGAGDGLEAALRAWQAEGGRVPFEPVLQLGFTRMHERRVADAARLFRSILTTEPEHAVARLHLGAAEIAVRDEEAAAADLRRAVEALPASADAHYHLAIALGRTGEAGQAESHLRQALALRPGHAQAALQLGNLYALQGDYDRAIAAFGESLRLNPDGVDAYRGLGAAHRLRGCWGDAAAALRAGLAVAPEQAGLALELALMYLAADEPAVRDVEQALVFAGQAMRADPENPEAMLTLAMALAMDDRGEAAMAVGRQARRFGATEAELALLGAIVKLRGGEEAAGRALYEQTLADEAAGAGAGSRRAHAALRKLAGEGMGE